MNTERGRVIHGCCDNCRTIMDDKLINIVSTFGCELWLCDDCLKGMSIMLNKTVLDNKEHIYCSTNKTNY